MKITVVTSSYPRFEGDGTAPFVHSISESLVQLGHSVEVIAPYDQEVRPCPQDALPVHRFYYAPLRRWHIMGHAKALANDTRFRKGVFLLSPLFFVMQLLMTLRVARRQKCDLVYAHWVVPGGIVGAWAARLLGVPLIVSLHGSDVFVAQRNRLLGRLARNVFGQAAVITACSPALREGALALGAPESRIHLVPWGANPIKFSPDVRPLDRAVFGLSESDDIVMSLGRLVPKKGFDVLVQVLPHLLPKYPALHVVIGGEGGERERLQLLAQTLGVSDHVHLVGSILWHQVPSFLTMGNIFALPSILDPTGNLDGLPTVLLEAMASGRAVVASRIAGVPLVIRNGSNGLLCSPGDIEEWAETISRVLEDEALCQKLGYEARRSVVENLNWITVTRNILTALELG